jgi:two-component system, LytTR family, response regulator
MKLAMIGFGQAGGAQHAVGHGEHGVHRLLLAEAGFLHHLYAHLEYMERAFEAHALDYVRKPFRESRFRDALHHARRRIAARRALPPESDPRIRAFLADLGGERSESRLKVSERSGELRLIPAEEVLCLEADEDYVHVHTGKESIMWRTTLTRAGEGLDPNVFLRVHRSYIVNTGRIRKVSRLGKGEYSIELESGRKVGTGRSYREAVEAFMSR